VTITDRVKLATRVRARCIANAPGIDATAHRGAKGCGAVWVTEGHFMLDCRSRRHAARRVEVAAYGGASGCSAIRAFERQNKLGYPSRRFNASRVEVAAHGGANGCSAVWALERQARLGYRNRSHDARGTGIGRGQLRRRLIRSMYR
jgi:hypothetical protein